MKILVADDDPINQLLLKGVLDPLSHDLYQAQSGQEARDFLAQHTFDLILSDIMMPDVDGLTLTRECREDPRHRDVPILIVTALAGRADLSRAFEAGATDFVTKPFHATELLHRIKAHLQLRSLQLRMESTLNELNLRMLEIDRQQKMVIEKERQLTEANRLLAEANRSLLEFASKDSLTGLLNRRKGWDYMNYEEEKTRRSKKPIGVALLDLDKFKSINDQLGHDAGDQVLKTACHALSASLRATDILIRWGGEEFLAVFPETDEEHLALVAEKVRRAIAEHPWVLADGRRVTVSVGAIVKQPGQPWDRVLELADKALYWAKEHGRNRVVMARAKAATGAEGP